jgi:methionyl-tRNA formyltransferase
MHPSLLPKYRGAAPIYHAMLNNEKITGVSVLELHPERFDAGRILKQVEMVCSFAYLDRDR